MQALYQLSYSPLAGKGVGDAVYAARVNKAPIPTIQAAIGSNWPQLAENGAK
jgi:hypothetical protein